MLIPGSQTAKIKFMEAEIKQVADIVTANILFIKRSINKRRGRKVHGYFKELSIQIDNEAADTPL